MHGSVDAIVKVGILLAAGLLSACGSDAVHNVDYGSPPDASLFDTGSGGGNGGYGEDGSGPAPDASAGPVCPPSSEQCPETFTYAFNGESTVELRGDYRSDAWVTGDSMKHVGNAWTVTVPVPYAQPVQYKFLVNGSQWVTDPANPNKYTDAQGDTNSLDPAITCANPTCAEPPVPPAGVYDWRDAVIYFVFVDRFFNGSPANDCPSVPGVDAAAQYMGGDWAGVTQQIQAGYFNDLGANVLWVTVPAQNADTYSGLGTGGDTHHYSSYHGYWPVDPTQRERCFGTPQELKAMVDAAHAKNLKIVFDYAMVDIHISAPIYTQNPGWFWPNSSPNGDCVCGQGCDWNANGLQCWFAPYLPHFNYTVAAARDWSVNNAIQLAMQTGADGFRLDAIKQVDTSWLLELRTSLDQQVLAAETPKQRFYLVGETYDFSNRPLIASFVDPKTKLDGQFDFPLRYQLLSSVLLKQQGMDALASFMDSNDDYYGVDAVMSTFIGNQDLPRSIHLAEDTPLWTNPYADGKDRAWSNQPQLPSAMSAFQRLGTAFAVLFTNRGAPLLYYGDEVGQPGAGDPDNRRMMPWSGLSANQTYLHDLVKALASARAAHPALRRGHRQTLSVSADLWVYSMTTTGDTVYVAINRADSDRMTTSLPAVALTELVTGGTLNGPGALIPARQPRIFVAK